MDTACRYRREEVAIRYTRVFLLPSGSTSREAILPHISDFFSLLAGKMPAVPGKAFLSRDRVKAWADRLVDGLQSSLGCECPIPESERIGEKVSQAGGDRSNRRAVQRRPHDHVSRAYENVRYGGWTFFTSEHVNGGSSAKVQGHQAHGS